MKSHRLTSHTCLGLNPQIGRPFSRIVGAIGFFFNGVFEPFKITLKINKPFQQFQHDNGLIIVII
jgi:hypothetical protein